MNKTKIMEEFNELCKSSDWANGCCGCPNTINILGGIKDFIQKAIDDAVEGERERIIDSVISVSSNYWISKNVGIKSPLIVNKNQFKKFVLFELSKDNHQKGQ